MTHAHHVDADCGTIIAAVFDLLAGTNLEPLAPELAAFLINPPATASTRGRVGHPAHHRRATTRMATA